MSEPTDIYTAPTSQLTADQKPCHACGGIINAKAEICPLCGVRQRKPISKPTLLIITILLGGFGAHKFYLGKHWQGVLYLLFFWTYIPTVVSLIECIIYAVTSTEKLNEKYSASTSVVLIIAIIVGAIFFLGILAAIAIPAYQDYVHRAKISAGYKAATDLQAAITARFNSNGPADMSCSATGCQVGPLVLAPISNVQSLSSDSTGAITVEYDRKLLVGSGTTLRITPLIDGQAADLSNAAQTRGKLTWACGQDFDTTIPKNLLPAACR